MLALRTPTLNRLVSATRLTPRWCRLFSSTSPTFSTAPAPTPPNPNKHYYVTTPIFYVNAGEHMGFCVHNPPLVLTSTLSTMQPRILAISTLSSWPTSSHGSTDCDTRQRPNRSC